MGDLTRLMTLSPQTRPTAAANPQRHGYGRGKYEGRWKRTAILELETNGTGLSALIESFQARKGTPTHFVYFV